jgi:hypothetical protein
MDLSWLELEMFQKPVRNITSEAIRMLKDGLVLVSCVMRRTHVVLNRTEHVCTRMREHVLMADFKQLFQYYNLKKLRKITKKIKLTRRVVARFVLYLR